MTVSAEESAPPALFDHCVRTYSAMLAEAKSVQVNEDTEDESGEDLHIIVYEGFLTQLITGQLNLSVPYYTSVRKALMRMGCIRQLRRGGSTTPSQWELIYQPTLEAFMRQAPPTPSTRRRQSNETIEQLRQQNNDLSKRISALEKWQADINSSLIRLRGKELV